MTKEWLVTLQTVTVQNRRVIDMFRAGKGAKTQLGCLGFPL